MGLSPFLSWLLVKGRLMELKRVASFGVEGETELAERSEFCLFGCGGVSFLAEGGSRVCAEGRS